MSLRKAPLAGFASPVIQRSTSLCWTCSRSASSFAPPTSRAARHRQLVGVDFPLHPVTGATNRPVPVDISQGPFASAAARAHGALMRLMNTTSRLIAMAASLVGSAERVMAAMQSSAENFRLYAEGTREPTWPELERLISLIVREQQKVISANRAAVSRAKVSRPD
jgi:hypothetical protein